jgi:hypothetical protein
MKKLLSDRLNFFPSRLNFMANMVFFSRRIKLGYSFSAILSTLAF